MSISTQDFSKGVDFTGLGTTASASDHNQLIEQGVPTPDASADLGRGLIIATTDSALNTPVIPDAATTTKWQRYVWVRRPYVSDPAPVSRLYVWNGALSNDATYKKWAQVTTDLSAIQTEVDTANANASTALAAANTAQSTANAASTAATAATTAATAATNAAAAAQTTANTASATATTANANASAALTASASATTAANANIGAARLVGYSGAFQMLRSNAAGTLGEWFDPRNEYVLVSNATTQTIATGFTWPVGVRTDTYVIPLLTVNSVGALCAITPITYVMTFAPGVYKTFLYFNLVSTVGAGTGTNFYASYYVALQKVSDSSIVLQSPTYSNAGVGSFSKQIQLMGLLSISNAAASTAYRMIFVGTTNSASGVASTGSITAEPLLSEFQRFAYIP